MGQVRHALVRCFHHLKNGKFGFNRKTLTSPEILEDYPKIENIQRTIETRNRPLDVSIPDILAYGVLYKMTLNFWL